MSRLLGSPLVKREDRRFYGFMDGSLLRRMWSLVGIYRDGRIVTLHQPRYTDLEHHAQRIRDARSRGLSCLGLRRWRIDPQAERPVLLDEIFALELRALRYLVLQAPEGAPFWYSPNHSAFSELDTRCD